MDGFGNDGVSSLSRVRGLEGRDDTDSINILGGGSIQGSNIVRVGRSRRV